MADATLPMHIVATEILPRLPAISLLRFKCVSKFFQTLISTPEFAHHHLRHSLSSDAANRQLILVGKVSGLYNFQLDSPEFPAVSLRFPGGITEGSGGGLFVVGSSNGLVCIGWLLDMIKYLALGETCRMLDMGFKLQVRKTFHQSDMSPPCRRQTMLFSATFPTEIQTS